MRQFAVKAGLLLAVAAITVTSVAYAANATGQSQSGVHQPLRNIAYVYTVQTEGGTGAASFEIPAPGLGVYLASFTANFGSRLSDPTRVYSCVLVKNGLNNLASSTATGRTTSDWYLGVNGQTAVKVTAETELSVLCGLSEDLPWKWGDRPLQVTLTRLDGIHYQPIGSMTSAADGRPCQPAAGAFNLSGPSSGSAPQARRLPPNPPC